MDGETQFYESIKKSIFNEFDKTKLLLEHCNLVESDTNSIKFSSQDIVKKNRDFIRKELKNNLASLTHSIIYKIEFEEVTKPSNLINQFKKKKNNDKAIKFCKLNSENLNITNQNKFTAYIGSSKKENICSRMYVHLGVGTKTTYGLQLKKWLELKNHFKIKIFFYEFITSVAIDNFSSLLEITEQALWQKERPVFGKKSGLL